MDQVSDIPTKKSKIKKREKFVIILLIILCGLLGSVIFYGYKMIDRLTNEIVSIKESQEEQKANQIETNQLLLSNMDWSTQRQKQTLFMRDMIIKEWRRLGSKERDARDISLNLNEAYDIADNIMMNSEIYPDLDPLLVLAICWKESSFWKRAKSSKGALGLMQVMPVTARPYFELFGISFSNRKLYENSVNVKVGTRFLDDVYATYGTVEKSLAYYNGGRWGATYYPDSLEKCAYETAAYVPKVISKYEEYKELYKSFRVDSSMVSIN